jgi:hypothetical protein
MVRLWNPFFQNWVTVGCQLVNPGLSCAQQNREVTSDEVIVLFVLVVACRWKSGPGSCQEAR